MLVNSIYLLGREKKSPKNHPLVLSAIEFLFGARHYVIAPAREFVHFPYTDIHSCIKKYFHICLTCPVAMTLKYACSADASVLRKRGTPYRLTVRTQLHAFIRTKAAYGNRKTLCRRRGVGMQSREEQEEKRYKEVKPY
jgi:hypothetical protein